MDGFDAARRVARWLATRAEDTAAGRCWPSIGCPDGGPEDHTLAWGPAGIVLFLLRAYETLGDEHLLADALAGARTLLAPLPDGVPTGFYRGLAGRAYVLAETYRVTGEVTYHHAAVRDTARLDANVAAIDVYDGLAGIGLALLHLATALDDAALVDRAVDVATRLLDLGIPTGTGLRWPDRGHRNELPNFSHGTAGVAFFLAAIGRVTGTAAFVDAAAAGGRYLVSFARDYEVPVVADSPETWPNWCNGTAGTARLWYALSVLTADQEWQRYLDGASHAILTRILPDGTIPDVANESTLCCGSAGLLDFLLDRYAATGRDAYLDGARRAVLHLERWSVDDGTGLRWVQGRRTRTGLLEGAAGAGYALLRAGAAERGLPRPAGLPDSPFAAPFAVGQVIS